VHGEQVDGNDVLAVREAADRLLRQARDERHPALLETITYRYRGHSVADAGKVYRTAEEVRSWRERDPITRYGLLLGERGIASSTDLDVIWQDVSAEVKDAIDRALAASFPPREGLDDQLYGDPSSREQFERMAAGAPYGERGEEQTWPT
jgi:TPP-dependent pyruvate/acetoin dehydrogenase alpha subunit